MYDFDQILETIPPKLKKGLRPYQKVYRLTESQFVCTDGVSLVLIPTCIPTHKQNKTFTHLHAESDIKYPNYQQIVETKRKQSLYNVGILNRLKNVKTKNLWLTPNGTLHTQETLQKETDPYSLNLELLYYTFSLLRGLKDLEIESTEQSDDDGMLILTCTNNIEIYVVFAVTQFIQSKK